MEGPECNRDQRKKKERNGMLESGLPAIAFLGLETAAKGTCCSPREPKLGLSAPRQSCPSLPATPAEEDLSTHRYMDTHTLTHTHMAEKKLYKVRARMKILMTHKCQTLRYF